ncbi:cell wall metabolism sensor histidine kinase WalK [Marmoricola sp. URHB0036]|uniref:sensor histidine kinase n=1 Tax=Marmoricola sp. URHB0036 TaxID=1298863 RepID=UPI000427FC03|nr:HAMP domain-containing sensor histidine kinase [Marmoricola sp. URHB0036]
MKAVGDEADLRRTSLRLGFQAGLLVVACLFVVGALIFVIYERAADAAANQLLSDTTTNIDAASEAPPGVLVVVVTPKGRSVSPGMPDGLPDEEQIAATTEDGKTRQVEIVRGGDTYTVRTATAGDRVTQAVLDRHEADEQRGRILTSLLTAGVAGVLLAALLAAWLARRTVRPMADTIAMQRRFVADASHELRTPLTLLSTRAQLLARRLRRDPRVTDQVVADVDGVVDDTRTLTEILDELLTAADTRSRAEWTAVDIGGLVEDVAGAATATAEKSNVTLGIVDLATARVEGSPASLRRALTALLDNAVSHARSAVTISVRTSGRRVEIEVSDDGPGIPDDVAPRLFDRFSSVRTESSTVDGRRHYGLGLALVADVAANHHGRVAVSDRADGEQGAVFTLTLPARSSSR